eukprot:SAG11_NODE_19811_length_458_cov_1.473538_1_plen_95_part_00
MDVLYSTTAVATGSVGHLVDLVDSGRGGCNINTESQVLCIFKCIAIFNRLIPSKARLEHRSSRWRTEKCIAIFNSRINRVYAAYPGNTVPGGTG